MQTIRASFSSGAVITVVYRSHIACESVESSGPAVPGLDLDLPRHLNPDAFIRHVHMVANKEALTVDVMSDGQPELARR